MRGLLDKIFLELDMEDLDETKGREYLHYLNEILPQIKSKSDFQKFIAIRNKLNKRLAAIGSSGK